MIEFCCLGQDRLNAEFQHPRRFGLGHLLRRQPVAGQRGKPGLGGQEITSLLVALRHGAGLAPRYDSETDELHQLQHIAAHAAPEAVPSLLVQHDMQRPVGLALVVGAIALKKAGGLLHDPAGQKFSRHEADVDLGNQAIILLDVVRLFRCHAGSAPIDIHAYNSTESAEARDGSTGGWARSRERNVFLSSCRRFRAQFCIPQRSPMMTAVFLALVTPVYRRLR